MFIIERLLVYNPLLITDTFEVNNYNHIFNVEAKHRNGHLSGLLDVQSKEIVIYDDYNGKELFRIGNQQTVASQIEEQYEEVTISIQVRNLTDTAQTAILFAANREPFYQPVGVTVIVQEIQSVIFESHNYLRRDILVNPIKLQGMKYYVSDPSQFINNLQVGYIPPYGKTKFQSFIPQRYLSPFQAQTGSLEAKDFALTVDANTQILVPINPKTTATLVFTAYFKKQINNQSRKDIYSNNPTKSKINLTKINNSNNSDTPKSSFNNTLLTVVVIGLTAINIYLLLKLKKDG